MECGMKYKLASGIFMLGLLGGCGTYVPELQEFYEKPDAARELVSGIVEQVQCEVQNGVLYVILEDMDKAIDPYIIEVEKKTGKKPGRSLAWLDNWAANVALTLTIDEKSSLNPGVVFNTPMIGATTTFAGNTVKFPVSVASSQAYNLGLGAQISADATRKEILYLSIDPNKSTRSIPFDIDSPKTPKLTPMGLKQLFDKGFLNHEKIQYLLGLLAAPCPHENGVFIESDLKLREWLEDVTLEANVQGGIVPDYAGALAAEAAATKKDVISHEVSFVIVYGGNITPTWKLVRVSANTGSGSFFGATRTKTQDLIITMGPLQGGAGGGGGAAGGGLSLAASNTILASQIGQAVASAIRNTQ
jgi:hypothetical protein